ncbi:hypothetical protein V2J09_017153 [Rumex salicifolius]
MDWIKTLQLLVANMELNSFCRFFGSRIPLEIAYFEDFLMSNIEVPEAISVLREVAGTAFFLVRLRPPRVPFFKVSCITFKTIYARRY